MAFSSPSRKRTAEPDAPPSSPSPSSLPTILDRKHHRRRNPAIDTWGLDVPTDPDAAATTSNNATCSAQRPTSTANMGQSQPFNIYKSLLRHPSLFPHFLISLPLASTISLYSIDKELHYLFNLYSLSLIHMYAHHHYPTASRVFSAALHPGLCISDPMLRPMDARMWLARDVPGWRWVGMVAAREGMVREIVARIEGGRVGKLGDGIEEALFKFWSLMDLPSTPVRRAYLADTSIWTNQNIAHVWMFLVKLDMRFTHPVTGNGSSNLSHLLLTQHSLTPLYNVLIGKTQLSYDKLETLVRYTYLNEDLDTDTYEWLLDAEDTNVPQVMWGVMMREGREFNGERMESVVDMVVEEGVRRELHLQERVLEFVMSGFVGENGKTLGRVGSKGRGEVMEMKGWPSKVERNEAIASLDKQLGLMKIGIGEVEEGHEMDLSH